MRTTRIQIQPPLIVLLSLSLSLSCLPSPCCLRAFGLEVAQEGLNDVPSEVDWSPGTFVRTCSVDRRGYPLQVLPRTIRVHVAPKTKDVDQDLVGQVPWVLRLLTLVCLWPHIPILQTIQAPGDDTTVSQGIETAQRFSHPDTSTLAKAFFVW